MISLTIAQTPYSRPDSISSPAVSAPSLSWLHLLLCAHADIFKRTGLRD